jgi:hypothetical protein
MSNPKRTREEIRQAIKKNKMKEQTPITAEDYINSQDNFLGRDWRNDDKELAKAFKEFSKHNEEAKVLEALEEVKTHIEKQPKLYPLSLWAKLSIMKDEATKQK